MSIDEQQAAILARWHEARAAVNLADEAYNRATERVLEVKERGSKEQIASAMLRLREASDALHAARVHQAEVRYSAGE